MMSGRPGTGSLEPGDTTENPACFIYMNSLNGDTENPACFTHVAHVLPCAVLCGVWWFYYSVDVLQRKLKGVRVDLIPAAEKPRGLCPPCILDGAAPALGSSGGLRWLLSVLAKHVGAVGAQSRTAPQPRGSGELP